MLVKSLMIAGVVLMPLPALVLGARGLLGRRRIGAFDPAERLSQVVLVALRALTLLLILALSGITLVSLVGAMIKNVAMPGLVYVFFFLDIAFAAIVLLSFGRRDRRPPRRRASPATR